MSLYFRLFLCIIFATHFIRSGEVLASLIVRENDETRNITDELYYAESSPSLKIGKEDLADEDILAFRNVEINHLNWTYSKKTRWLKFDVLNLTARNQERYIVFNTPLTGNIFVLNSDARLEAELGSSTPGLRHAKKSTLPIYKINLAPKEHRVFYWAVRTRHSISGEILLTKHPEVISGQQDMAIWFYFGGILALFFFNLLTYIFTREDFYKTYLFYVSSFLFFILTMKGKLDQWLPLPFSTFSIHLICFTSILLITALIFTKSFLNMQNPPLHVVWIRRVIYAIAGVFFVTGLTPVYDYICPYPGHIIDITVIFACFFMIYQGLLVFNENKLFATIYLLSWSFIFIGAVSWFFMKWGLIPGNFITQNVLLIANLLEMSTLSLGVSLRQLEWQKEKAHIKQKAQEKEKLERLLKVLTHDLANPLTLIYGNAKKLIIRDELTYQNPSLDKILIATDNMRKVLAQVREEQLLNLRPTTQDSVLILDALNISIFLFEEQLQKKHISIELNLKKDLKLEIDKTVLINNVFNNVLSNAIKFSNIGGLIKIHSFSTTCEIIVEFRDYGIGMSQEAIDQFNQFEKIASTQGTTRETGSGFGLNLIRDYVGQYNGRIEIKSPKSLQEQNDQGTIVRLIFPVEKKSH